MAATLAALACAPCPRPAALPPAPPGSLPASATPAPPVAPSESAAPASREKLAVLPLEEESLFRDERTRLRELMARQIGKLMPELDVLPLTEVDAGLRPLSKSGARCAFEGEPLSRRARNKGWLTTDVMHVSGLERSAEELWIQVSNWQGPQTTLAGAWNRSLERTKRYEAALSSLRRLPDGGGLLGGLGGRFLAKGEVHIGPLTLCQREGFSDCSPETKTFGDRAKELTACFTGSDDEQRVLLFEGAQRCELRGLVDPSGTEGKLEGCLCAALASSAGAKAFRQRSELVLHFEALDLSDKPRPEIRVIDATANLHAEDDWHSMRHEEQGKTRYSSVRRLVIDNIDALRAPLSRCSPPKGSVIAAQLSLTESGAVQSGRVLSGAKSPRDKACIEKALARATTTCTNDGKEAEVRLAISWPE